MEMFWVEGSIFSQVLTFLAEGGVSDCKSVFNLADHACRQRTCWRVGCFIVEFQLKTKLSWTKRDVLKPFVCITSENHFWWRIISTWWNDLKTAKEGTNSSKFLSYNVRTSQQVTLPLRSTRVIITL